MQQKREEASKLPSALDFDSGTALPKRKDVPSEYRATWYAPFMNRHTVAA